MNTRFQKIVLGLIVVLCAGLTGLWLQARTNGKTLQAALTTAQATADEALRSSAEDNNRITALNAEISEQQKALGHTPKAQETKRRAAALVVIEQLKLAHEKTPPTPRQKAPPNGPTGGPFLFLELLSDPEYNQLYAQQNLRMTRYIEGRKLRELGLSPEAFEKVITILAEKQMSLTDYHQITGNTRSSGDFAKQLTEASDKALKEVMGEEIFRRWEATDEPKMVFVPNATGTGMHAVASHEALVAQAKQYLPKLSTRLSYTDTPLAAEQTGQLAE